MHPYENLGEQGFWATAVGKRSMFDIEGLWDPKFKVGRRMKVATFGSCFAQHFGRALEGRGFRWFVTEPAPLGLGEASARRFSYDVFSARTGNIYTASLLRQWVRWAAGDAAVPDEVWEKDGRFFDPFRPAIEPDGFASAEELVRSREMAIEAFRRVILESDIFAFTLGLTESWFHRTHGYEYPLCPGTAAGEFDAGQHVFVNQDYGSIRKALVEAFHRMRELRPGLKFLLTVSPVPLTATMSGNHVLVATMESKSILRAVAGSLRQQPYVDYFPSYELISSPPFRGTFFEPNQRSVTAAGVEHVMKTFFGAQEAKFGVPETLAGGAGGGPEVPRSPGEAQRTPDDVVCEEELLGAFAK